MTVGGVIPKLPMGYCTSNHDCATYICTHPHQPWCILLGSGLLHLGSLVGRCECV